MLFGSFFIALFIVSIALLAAISFGKVGTIVITSTFSVIIPVVSLVLTTVSEASSAYERITHTSYDSSIYGVTTDKADDKVEQYRIIPQNIYLQNEHAIHNSYETTAWIDIWGQTSSTFGMFMPSNVFGINRIKMSPRDVSQDLFDKFYTHVSNLTHDGYINFLPKVHVNNAKEITKQALTNMTGFAKDVNAIEAIINKSILKKGNFYLGYQSLIQQIVEVYRTSPSSLMGTGLEFESSSSKAEKLKINSLEIDTPIANSTYDYSDYNKTVSKEQAEQEIKDQFIAYLIIKDFFNNPTSSPSSTQVTNEIISSFSISSTQADGFVNYIDKKHEIYYYVDSKNFLIKFVDQNGTPSIDLLKNYLIKGLQNNYEISPYVPKEFTLSFWPILIVLLFGVSFFVHTKKDFK